jgi:hypothetical protein
MIGGFEIFEEKKFLITITEFSGFSVQMQKKGFRCQEKKII